uniref:Uncharacterized protein n=1 Tax=Desertifilum tharense IPPAS B-1220 TaxID=1781255 RepID=A0ACD5GVT1_9CYAN
MPVQPHYTKFFALRGVDDYTSFFRVGIGSCAIAIPVAIVL